jgi:hypothetical protein
MAAADQGAAEEAMDFEPPPPPAFEEPESSPEPPDVALAMPEDDGYDAFAPEPPFRPRRSRGRMLAVIAVIVAVLLLAAAAAIAWFGIPGFVPRTMLARAESPLDLEITHKPERRTMESGNELLVVSGRIFNPTDKVQRVPQIHAKLRDAQNRIVYQWSISAPVEELRPNESATFNSAEMNVPRSAQRLIFDFGKTS